MDSKYIIRLLLVLSAVLVGMPGAYAYTTGEPVLTTITILPADASVPVGGNATFVVDARDQYGNSFPATVTWMSSNTTVGYISGNMDGTGWFHGFELGTTTITATNGSVSGSTVVTVTEPTPPELFRIVVLPYGISVVAGNTQTFTAYPEDQYGNPFPATVAWASSNTAVGTIDSTGLFTAIAEGTTTITAYSGNISGTATATVTAPVTAGTVTFVVTDSVSSLPIKGASVVMDGINIKTDGTGKAIFTNVPVGDHTYTVSKSGYRRTTATVGVTGDTTVSVALVPR